MSHPEPLVLAKRGQSVSEAALQSGINYCQSGCSSRWTPPSDWLLLNYQIIRSQRLLCRDSCRLFRGNGSEAEGQEERRGRKEEGGRWRKERDDRLIERVHESIFQEGTDQHRRGRGGRKGDNREKQRNREAIELLSDILTFLCRCEASKYYDSDVRWWF